MTTRIGQGLDVHSFDHDRPLVLGGVRISDLDGLAGHSDGDAVLHALTDALLGAVGAGDIGEYFPSNDQRWKDVESSVFVRQALVALGERSAEISNVDITIVSETPRLSPHRASIRRNVAELLGIPEGDVNVKATTTDRLGFTGRGEGLCAMAVVAVEI